MFVLLSNMFMQAQIDYLTRLQSNINILSAMQLISHKHISGVYTILPFGQLINNFICRIITRHQNEFGIQVTMPSITDVSIYTTSDRTAEFQKEIFKFDKKLSLQATSEEMAIISLISHQISYKYLPKYFYQISKKFRREIRPRNNIIRCLEFDMKDGYSFDTNKVSAIKQYEKLKKSYQDIFNEMGIKYKITQADTKSMLAQNSEEFIHPDNKVIETNIPITGIEIAHIFYLGTHYSDKFNIKYLNDKNQLCSIHMGSYGIGIYRLIYIYIKLMFEKELKENMYLFDICFVPRGDDELMYATAKQICQTGKRILYIDTYNIKYEDRINIAKILPSKLVVYEKAQQWHLFDNIKNTENIFDINIHL